MQNKLKDATTDAILKLNEAGVKTIMATGDNALTGISVAQQCGILDINQDLFLGDLEENSVTT